MFKIKTSRDEYALPEEALLGRQVKKNDSVVSFFTQDIIADNKGVTKEKLTGEQSPQNSDVKKVDTMDKTIDKPKTRRSFL